MIKVSVDLDNNLLMQIQAQLKAFTGENGKNILPATKMAFDQCAALIQRSWRNWAMGGSIRGAADIRNPNPKLASSIHISRMHDFDVTIGTDSPYMERIRNGQKGVDIDMKDPNGAWLTSRRTRVTQSGKHKGLPYLIIPFRWGTPNKDGSSRAHFRLANTIDLKSMAILKGKSRSKKTGGTHTEKNIHGEDILREEYKWGDRLTEEETSNPNEVGMVKMLDEAGGNKNRPKSTYFTFRVISAHSKADWHIHRDPVPPNDVVQALKDSLRPQVENLIEQGFLADLDME